MKKILKSARLILLLVFFVLHASQAQNKLKAGFTNATDFGFSPESSGIENVKALQMAVNQGGTILVSTPGEYKLAGTVYIGDNTSLIFANNVFLKKVDEQGAFTHIFLNKGALTKTWNEHISIDGLYINVNGIDKAMDHVYGLRGQIAFFYVRDLQINHFRCLDLGKAQFCIHVCTFEDFSVNDAVIKGKKDGIHLGRGKRFKISNCVFQTYDDAIALNAHDYASSNPELGWIEEGVVENCYDLNQDETVGFFCRILAGAWIDWKPEMEVQQSDAVVSNGRVYRVQAKADGTIYKSVTRPTHEKGSEVIDGINWGVVQEDVTYTAGVRNVTFRDIFLEKPRTAFSIHFDNNKYSRSYYPGAEVPKQEQLYFENIRILYDDKRDLVSVGTPVDVITISNSSIRNNQVNFHGNKAMTDYLKTLVNIYGCVFNYDGEMDLVINSVERKEVFLKTSANIGLHDGFKANVVPGNGIIKYESDLKGLER